MAHVRIWKFRPPPGREQEFADAYSRDGVWAKLFGRGQGYYGTELLRPTEPGGWWVTIDRWAAAEDFAAFHRDFGEAYRALDVSTESIAGEEEFVGAFEGQ